MDRKITIEPAKYSKSWPWKMAWRDSRKSRGKLLLFIASISLGIAAMVGITSFRENLLQEIDNQAKGLVGSDVRVRGRRDLPDSLLHQFKSLTVDHSKESYFASMVMFTESKGTRLVQVRALEGDYPYYGAIETKPEKASQKFRDGRFALVDEKMMIQYDAQVGDSLNVGALTFEIIGAITQIPGQTDVSSSVSPVVYIPYRYLESTGLIQKGSRINYVHYFQFSEEIDTTSRWKKLASHTESKGYDVETVEEEKRETGEDFENLANFLELVAFTALLLGCLGVASAIYVYAKSKVQAVAVLRCLGMKAKQAVRVYLIQVTLFGFIGSIIGSLLGLAIHLYLPVVVQDFLPIDLVPQPYWPALVVGVLIGIVISLLFGLLSLIGLRKISPLSAIRLGFGESKFKLDKALIPIVGGIILFIFLSVFWQIQELQESLAFSGILIGAIALLGGIGKGVSWLTRKLVPQSMKYVWRQGFSNLYRPNNQTVILITALGLGTAFLATLYFMQDLLVQRVSLSAANDRPNTVLFDIQSEQHEQIKELTRAYDLPISQDVPVVTMRLLEVKGYTKDQAFNDTTVSISDWAYSREYRVTYRDSLIDSEKIVEGEWIGEVRNDSIYISISEGFKDNLDIELGDELVFNVQGAILKTYVGSFREIDWRRVQTNFLVLFPKGALERAPQFHVLVTRVDDMMKSVRYQQEVVSKFPNVSIIDLELILKTLEDVLGKVAFVIQFMAFFSIGTGIIVMISSIILSKFQRVQENVLLRTLGASKKQLWTITIAEYFFLGALGALSGILLAGLFTTLLGQFVFEFTFIPNASQIGIVFVLVTGMSILIGLLNSRSVVRESPMEVLRREG
ncbi:ABC transporter permease [Ekhidna sp.]|uniref:ABC transporter permease n=1 Tax=Ekhidna sp. TaxID=2608089 RepID=UPI003C7B077F